MKFLFFFISLFITLSINAQTLMINEISQGSGSSEYVELVVVGTPTCSLSCMNLQHMIFDDNNGTFASGSGVGISAGAMRFSGSPFWKCIPYGTIIVLYNAASPNPYLPSDDYSLLDDNVLVIPSTSTLLESTITSPTLTNPLYPANSFWGTGTSTWNSTLAMGNSNDSFQVRDSNGVLLHSISWGNNNSNTILFFTPSLDYSFVNTTSNIYTSTTNWSLITNASLQTPGDGNSPQNTSWINQMNTTTNNIILGNINHN